MGTRETISAATEPPSVQLIQPLRWDELRAAELFLLSNLFLVQAIMCKTRKKRELTFEVIEDREMPKENFEAVVEMLTESLWAGLERERMPSSSIGDGGEVEPKQPKDGTTS
ncbi:MAG TPA: hypothetical protein VJN65_04510 [Bacteroidota bacterium]|nr:hypothetical protein [Bacteroidota bacterium]